LVVAHRGASGVAPENTISSIQAALEIGARMVEVDVHTSSDGEIVVIHDPDVSRTTNGKGLISEMSLAQIRTLDAGSWFGPRFRGEPVPTLDEALELVRGKADLCIELKSASPRQVIDKVLEHGYLDHVIIFDFNHARLGEARKIQPSVRTLALGISQDNIASLDPGVCGAVGCPLSRANGQLVEKAHRFGLAVFVYTVNEVDGMKKLAELGVYAIITDFPELALEILSKRLARPPDDLAQSLWTAGPFASRKNMILQRKSP